MMTNDKIKEAKQEKCESKRLLTSRMERDERIKGSQDAKQVQQD